MALDRSTPKWKRSAVAAAVAAIAMGPLAPDAWAAPLPGGSLNPLAIPKYVDPLTIPPAMPRVTKLKSGTMARDIDYYEVAVRQFRQQVLPTGLPMTTVWSYGAANDPTTFNYPAFTIEAKFSRAVRVKWINDLKSASGNYLPHLLPIDQTLHWANPPGGTAGRDSRTSKPEPYTGPVPIIVHLHGGHAGEWADGFPEAWYLPDAIDIPEGYATEGSKYSEFKGKAEAALGCSAVNPWGCWGPGTAVFQYDNVQDASTLWYHDHSLGMTRTNVYAGPAGFYLLRGGPSDAVIGTLPGPAPALGDLPGTRYYEIPIAIQDRSFDGDGSLFYPGSREFFDLFAGPYVPEPSADGTPSDVSPLWNPEFFGNTMVVNGKTWPYLTVEARRYRFRFLNGSDSRFLILATDYVDPVSAAPLVPFWQIGADGGFLPAPVSLDTLLLGPAERADVIMDFTNVPPGTDITLVNLGPDEPFGGGVPGVDFDPADPGTTGQVMRFRVVKRFGRDPSTRPGQLVLPAKRVLPAATSTRQVSLNELDSAEVCVEEDSDPPTPIDCDDDHAVPFGPREAQLGTVMDVSGVPMGMPMMWADHVTENPAVGATEIWEMFNFTMDAHPIHIHEIMFEVVDRQPFDMETGTRGPIRPPELWETGFKDTVVAYPGEITRVKATFDRAGLFVWHCHILSHEDNEMMRPYRIGAEPAPPAAP
jgi:spore coat protein A